MNRKSIILGLVIAISIMAISSALIFNINSHKRAYPAYPYAKILIKSLLIDNDTYKISLKYPYLGVDSVDKVIDKMIKAETHAFLISVPKKNVSPNWKYELYVNGDTSYFSKNIISLNFEVYTFTGGAHGSTVKMIKVLNVATAKEIKLTDIFVKGTDVPKKLSAICIPLLIKQLGNTADIKWIKEGAGPKDINYTKFMLTPKYLVIFFGQYQVAPYYLGIQEVKVPLKDISVVLTPTFRNFSGGR